VWGIAVAAIMYYYWLGDKMFRYLEVHHPKYYKKCDMPLYFSDIVSNYRASNYLSFMIYCGIPKEFPKDEKARELAKRNILVGRILYGLIFCAVVTMWVFID
jgi:hypothetical protein